MIVENKIVKIPNNSGSKCLKRSNKFITRWSFEKDYDYIIGKDFVAVTPISRYHKTTYVKKYNYLKCN
jgi:hypothetical protein